jgi:nitroreductase
MDLGTVDHLLTTTRSVRKRLDFSRPIEPAVVEECIALATQAPTGSNAQGWHFVVVADPDLRASVSALYRKSFMQYIEPQRSKLDASTGESPRDAQQRRVLDSALYLADHMQEAPILIIPCIDGRVEHAGPMAQAGLYGSILPATWSLMLALRARGLGSAWTTLHLRYERKTAELLGIPANVTQAALLPVAYIKGPDLKPAKRLPVRERTYWDRWDKTK